MIDAVQMGELRATTPLALAIDTDGARLGRASVHLAQLKIQKVFAVSRPPTGVGYLVPHGRARGFFPSRVLGRRLAAESIPTTNERTR